MRRIVIAALLGLPLALAGCIADDDAPGTVAGVGPTSIAGAPRAATSAWTTPSQGAYLAAPQAPARAMPAAAPRLPTAPPAPVLPPEPTEPDWSTPAPVAPSWTPPAPPPAPEPAPAPGAGGGCGGGKG